jgi:hypothetical protein
MPNCLAATLRNSNSARVFQCDNLETKDMSLILIIVVLLLLFGGGGYYGYNRYGGAGLGGVLGLVLTILVILWLFGALGGVHI